MSKAEALANQPYTPYTEPRIAPFGSDQLQAFDMSRGVADEGAGALTSGENLTGLAAVGFGNSGYNPSATAGTYNPGTFNPDQVGTAQWDSSAASQYMNPYISNVLDQLTARQNQNYDMARLQRNAQAAKSGTFGGYRQGVEEGVARGQHEMNLGDLIAGTLRSGYDTAFNNFSTDKGRLLQADTSNQAAGLEAMRMGEGSRQFGANFEQTGAQFDEGNRLRAAQQQLALSQGLGAMGAQATQQGIARQDALLKGIGSLRDTGLDQQRQTQASLDQAYNDFVNQRDYTKSQLTWLNDIIRGNTTSANTNVTQTEATNPYTQMLGLGIGAVGLANAMGVGQGQQARA